MDSLLQELENTVDMSLKTDLSQEIIDVIDRSHGYTYKLKRQNDNQNTDAIAQLILDDAESELNEEKVLLTQYDEIEMYKYKIMKMLTSDSDLIKILNNKELQGHSGDDYRFVNIFNFLKIPDTQSTVKNFVCFEVNDVEQSRYNECLIKKYIIFRTISHGDDVQTSYGMARQDLLALIIKNKFDWSKEFGMHLEKIQDYGKVTENGYYYREFIYETTTVNNLVNKTKNI